MNLPASFIDYTRALLGNEEYEKLAAALQQEPPVSIRINKLRMKEEGLSSLTDSSAHFSFNKVPWASDGYYLDERLTFTFDPLFHAGCYYVQEASSMFVEQVLAENLTKWGHPDVVVTNNDPADFSALPSFFDVILTDVPCSGEGMFRKDPVAVEEWSPENVEICWQRQRRIIADIWPCLKPGGILIYSTCTYNSKEDEENVCWIQQEFGAELLPLEVRNEWNITGNLLDGEDESQGSLSVCHFLPHKTKGEGFFLAALRKPDAEDEPAAYSFSKAKASKKKDKKGGAAASPVSKEHMGMALNWLKQENVEKCTLSAEGAGIIAFPQRYTDELAAMKQHLKVIQAGVLTGEVKGRDLIPAHALAMSATLLRQDAFDTEEVSYEQAIAYLRKEAITLSETAPRGYILLTYRNIPLGFVKNIGNRANNLYPQEWRIRSGYLPEEIRTL